MNAAVHAGIYCRLSVEDETSQESESIQTQKVMLTDFCKNNGFHIVDYYIDDGETGTNFERPGFQRMLADIKAGKINTVICKDLSRFGRNYYEAGMYLDKYFVENNIRFIAPGNNVDSAKGGYDLTVPFLNMFNDFYARDISAKTKAAKETRAKQGMFLGSKAPYGYMKDPEDKHHLIVDEEAAKVVRRIFQMAADGAGYNRIAKTLQNEGIPNPYSYHAMKNPGYLAGRNLSIDTRWHVTSVQMILRNPAYRGDCVNCRQGNKIMHGRQLRRPEDEWIVVHDTHEALVSPEQWDQVQRLLGLRRKCCQDGDPQMFAGLLYCSDCGSALSFSKVHHKTKPDSGKFKCWYYSRYGTKYCSSHYITLEQLTAVLLDDIRRQAYYAKNFRLQYLQDLTAAQTKRDTEALAEKRGAMERDKARLSQLDQITRNLLEKNAMGMITDQQFAALNAQYADERTALEDRLGAYRSEEVEVDAAAMNAVRFAELVEDYLYIEELDARILNRLIEKIVVHQRQKEPDGSQTQQIDIYYRFLGQLQINPAGLPEIT